MLQPLFIPAHALSPRGGHKPRSLGFFFTSNIILSVAFSQSRGLVRVMSYICTTANSLESVVTCIISRDSWVGGSSHHCSMCKFNSRFRKGAFRFSHQPDNLPLVPGRQCLRVMPAQTQITLLAPKMTVQCAQYPGHPCRSPAASLRHWTLLGSAPSTAFPGLGNCS